MLAICDSIAGGRGVVARETRVEEALLEVAGEIVDARRVGRRHHAGLGVARAQQHRPHLGHHADAVAELDRDRRAVAHRQIDQVGIATLARRVGGLLEEREGSVQIPGAQCLHAAIAEITKHAAPVQLARHSHPSVLSVDPYECRNGIEYAICTGRCQLGGVKSRRCGRTAGRPSQEYFDVDGEIPTQPRGATFAPGETPDLAPGLDVAGTGGLGCGRGPDSSARRASGPAAAERRPAIRRAAAG